MGQSRMGVLARFAGPNGEILVMEDRCTGVRLYREGGVNQSWVLAGGHAGVDYIRLMATLLAGGSSVLLLGCGGGALASMLYRGGRSVTVVDVNPHSFALARTFFWMPCGVNCVVGDMREFVRTDRRKFDAIGIDVGGPCFSYEEVIEPATVANVRSRLRNGGRIAVNISCEAPDDQVPARVADMFKAEGLDVWVFKENAEGRNEANAVILAVAGSEQPAWLAAVAEQNWLLARLAT
jgi:SAM-dependent methyltransferase